MRLILEVVDDNMSKFGRSMIDGHAQNFRPAITSRKRSQTGRTWSCDQWCRVVASIAQDHELTSCLAIDWATMRLVAPFVEQFHDWQCDLLRSVTTGYTTLNWSDNQSLLAGGFILNGFVLSNIRLLCDPKMTKISSWSFVILPGLTKFTPNFM